MYQHPARWLVLCALTFILPAAAADFQLMRPAQLEQLRGGLPLIADPDVQEIVMDERTLYYTEREMPRCYQDWDGALQGVISAHYNISANGSEPYGNGNLEFPWGTPGGTHRCDSMTTFRFLRLPDNAESGGLHPIVWYRKRFAYDTALGYGWLFPVGTVVGEVLMRDDPEGPPLAFEIRLRIREQDSWAVDVLRPFPTAADLAQRIQQLRPDWRERPRLAAVVAALTESQELVRHRLVAQHPHAPGFRQGMGLDSLPPLDDDPLVRQLLRETPFQSALGTSWRRGTNGIRTNAPTTGASFHIVPRNYDAGFIDVDRQSCLRCHDAVNRHVRDFNFTRDWYGRIRGSDGIFSFHPFALDSISHNGYGLPIRMRDELVRSGMLAPYDPKQHPRTVYHPIAELEH